MLLKKSSLRMFFSRLFNSISFKMIVHVSFYLSRYEPELFPGLVYRMQKPKIVLLIFVSGKIVLTGAKVREQIYQAFNNIFPILKNFMKLDTEKQISQQHQQQQLPLTLTN